jgi:hypothetical protein
VDSGLITDTLITDYFAPSGRRTQSRVQNRGEKWTSGAPKPPIFA